LLSNGLETAAKENGLSNSDSTAPAPLRAFISGLDPSLSAREMHTAARQAGFRTTVGAVKGARTALGISDLANDSRGHRTAPTRPIELDGEQTAQLGARVDDTSKRLNKSQWIRSQPKSLSAREVVERAKAEGIVLTMPQVYTARATSPRSASAKRGRGSSSTGRVELLHQFTVLAVRLGTEEAQRVLDRLITGKRWHSPRVDDPATHR